MACVGGGKSDEPSDNVKSQCDRCQHDGLIKGATKFCRECEEYMCTPCAKMHRGFKQSRDHEFVSVCEPSSSEESDPGNMSLSYCTQHADKLMDLFCADHDAMFCESCRLVQHRICEVVTLVDKATVTTCGEELAAALESMVPLKARIETLKGERQNDIEALNNLRISRVEEINQFKTKLIELIESLEKKIINDVEKVVATEMNVLQKYVTTFDDMLSQLEMNIRSAEDETSPDADGMTSLLVAHKLRQSVRVTKETLADIEPKFYTIDMTFFPSVTLNHVCKSADVLGTLIITPESAASHSVSPTCIVKAFGDMDVESSTVINLQADDIRGSAILPDGQVILTDYSNKNVILLDKIFNIQSTLSLPQQPWGVAVTGSSEVVVCLPNTKQLQWIRVDTALHADRTVTTDGVSFAVAVHDGDIYTMTHAKGCAAGDVKVRDRQGTVTRSIGMNTNGQQLRLINFPNYKYITVSSRGDVYVSDTSSNNRVRRISNSGDVIYDVNPTDMLGPCDMLLDEDYNLVVCCEKSNAIHVLKNDGSHKRVILSSADGVVKPRSLVYRHADKTLIIAMADSGCVAYKLK